MLCYFSLLYNNKIVNIFLLLKKSENNKETEMYNSRLIDNIFRFSKHKWNVEVSDKAAQKEGKVKRFN